MKISELITALEQHKKTYGDIDVNLFDETTKTNYKIKHTDFLFISKVFCEVNSHYYTNVPFVDLRFNS